MSRQERRALERKARKQARKDLNSGAPLPTVMAETTTESAPAAPPATQTAPTRREPIILTAEQAAMFPNAAKLIANYNNAQKSTGPRTPEGKAISSQNNFRHGLRGAFKILPNEDESEFANLLRSLREEHAPATATEEILVQQVAEHFWLTRRAKGFQDTMILNPETFTIKMMNTWLRYETQHQRAFHKCLADLLKLREQKRKAELHAKKLCAISEQLRSGFEWKRQREELHDLKKRIATARAEAQERKNDAKNSLATPPAQLAKEQAA